MARSAWGTIRLALLGLLLAAGLGCGESAVGKAPPPPARLVLVTIDTLRADHVGAFGAARAHTATLDALAASGARFDTAISPAPITLPSHTTLLTGLIPPSHGVRNNSTFRLAEQVPTLATHLRARGFATAAFVGAIVLDRQYGLARGFDVYDDQMGPRKAAGDQGFAERTADRVVDSALAWLEGAPDRFFLWAHFYDPHANYDPPTGFRAAFPTDPYAGEIAFADSQLGRLLAAIDERFDPAGTVVVVTSDHGEALGEHGEVTHSLSIYEATQHVPLVMRGPGIAAGSVIGAPVGLVDVAPTATSLMGLPPLGVTDGRDLAPLIAGAAPGSGDAEHEAAEGAGRTRADDASAVYMETLATQMEFGWSPLLGLRTARYRYIRAPRPELYVLADDPHELDDRSAEEPETVSELDARLTALLDSAASPGASRLAPDDETRARLQELGYVVAPEVDGARPLGEVGGIDPKDAMSNVQLLIRAMQANALGRPDRALELLAQVPDGGWILDAFRAVAALEARQWAGAEAFARSALERAPDHAGNWISLGEALEGLGRLDEAEAAFLEAERVDPAHGAPVAGRGRIAEARGDLDRARTLYREAIARRGGSAEAHWRLAALAIEAGEDPTPWLEPLSTEALLLPKAALRLAAAEVAAGDSVAARARLKRASEQLPQHAFLREALEALDN